MLRVIVRGDDTLAVATAQCCSEHFDVARLLGVSCDVLWICYDTPTLANHRPDVEAVLSQIDADVSATNAEALILISSQLPVGTTRRLEQRWPDRIFAHSPENIRIATAIEDFRQQARVVVGLRQPMHEETASTLRTLFMPFTDDLIFTDTETAECVKHAVNGYLALCIAFANELAAICQAEGADAHEVTRLLKKDRRVSPLAPLKPGAPYGGGHLEREIFNLREIAGRHGLVLPIIQSIQASNER